MKRVFSGFAICLAVGAAVSFSGLGSVLGLDEIVPAQVPDAWAPMPSAGRIDVTLISSENVVSALATGLSGSEVALHRPGALALIDGRVFAVSGAAARNLLRDLAWDGLPIDARQASASEIERFTAPAPASLTWQAQRHGYQGLRTARDFLASRPVLTISAAAACLLLLLHAGLAGLHIRRSRHALPAEPSPWRLRRAELPVRVVLVPDVATLAQVRVAIGEEHVVAATEHAFAFADGWILAVRKGSVFELVSELGWRMRPIEMASRSELVGEGHALSPIPGDDPSDALGLLEALHVCGPVAHGTIPRIATGVVSHA